MATLLLQRLGHAVSVVDNGRRALDVLAESRFDLVLMDCHMPEMDGFDATRAMRGRGDRTPVVALTAASLPEERQRCLASGMADVLLKPIDRNDLSRVLARYGRRTTGDAAASLRPPVSPRSLADAALSGASPPSH